MNSGTTKNHLLETVLLLLVKKIKNPQGMWQNGQALQRFLEPQYEGKIQTSAKLQRNNKINLSSSRTKCIC